MEKWGSRKRLQRAKYKAKSRKRYRSPHKITPDSSGSVSTPTVSYKNEPSKRKNLLGKWEKIGKILGIAADVVKLVKSLFF